MRANCGMRRVSVLCSSWLQKETRTRVTNSGGSVEAYVQIRRYSALYQAWMERPGECSTFFSVVLFAGLTSSSGMYSARMPLTWSRICCCVFFQ